MPIKKLSFESSDILGYRFSGVVSEKDCVGRVLKDLSFFRQRGQKAKLYLEFAKGFKGLEMNSRWEDSKFALRFMRIIEKCAVSTDRSLFSRIGTWLGGATPFSLKVFNLGQAEAAKAWLEWGKEGAWGCINEQEETFYLEVRSSFRPQDLEPWIYLADSFLMGGGEIKRLLLSVEKCPSAQGPSGFWQTMDFWADAHELVEKIAWCGPPFVYDEEKEISSHFGNALVARFPKNALEAAKTWLKESLSSGKFSQEPNWEGPQGPQLQ